MWNVIRDASQKNFEYAGGNMKKRTSKKKTSFGAYFTRNWQLYVIFLLPALILTFIFKYLPMFGIIIAFENYSPIQGFFGSKWIGLYNFHRLFASTEFPRLLLNTIKLSTYNLLWSFFPPIVLALLLNQVVHASRRTNIQLVLYLPYFISTIVLAGMVRLFFSPVGPINQLFGTSVDFMAEPSWFRTLYIGSGIWQTTGWSSIIYTATLANVSPELIDAAKIDGATLIQRIRNVDLPALRPVIIIQFVLSAGNIMSIGFEKVYAMQTSLNMPTSDIIATYVYRMGLENGDYGYSTAVGLFNSVVNLIILLIVNIIVKKLNEGEGI
jgi:putative aldouronate transport system permease protein